MDRIVHGGHKESDTTERLSLTHSLTLSEELRKLIPSFLFGRGECFMFWKSIHLKSSFKQRKRFANHSP